MLGGLLRFVKFISSAISVMGFIRVGFMKGLSFGRTIIMVWILSGKREIMECRKVMAQLSWVVSTFPFELLLVPWYCFFPLSPSIFIISLPTQFPLPHLLNHTPAQCKQSPPQFRPALTLIFPHTTPSACRSCPTPSASPTL